MFTKTLCRSPVVSSPASWFGLVSLKSNVKSKVECSGLHNPHISPILPMFPQLSPRETTSNRAVQRATVYAPLGELFGANMGVNIDIRWLGSAFQGWSWAFDLEISSYRRVHRDSSHRVSKRQPSASLTYLLAGCEVPR